jgi:dTDP-4-amino-4,6-dideoxygalactose transaminase
MIKLLKPHFPQNIGKKIEDIFKKGEVTEGYYSEKFENLLSNYIKNKNCVLVNSGTSALTLAYKLLNLKKNDEVITTPFTCMATNEPLFNENIKFKFCDIEKYTGNACLKSIKKLINYKTRAIVVVHWGGQPVDINKLKKIIKNKKIKIIEDAAHALGAELDGKKIGCHGDFICFSFQAVKQITTGDGGLLVCKKTSDAKKAKLLRWFGLNRNYKGNKWLQDIKYSGYKFHLNNLASRIGCEQMKYLNKIIYRHRWNAKFYDKNINNSKIIKINKPINTNSSCWLYSILVDNKKKFKNYLIKKKISCDEISFRNDRYTIFKKYKKKNLNGTSYFSKHMVNIPVGWWLKKKDIIYIAKTLNNYH